MNCPHCHGNNIKFDHTTEDWYEGDEYDWYLCLDCKTMFKIYIPR